MSKTCEYGRLQYASFKVVQGEGDRVVIPVKPFKREHGIPPQYPTQGIQELFTSICSDCGLCKPHIVVNQSEVRIDRRNYRPELIDKAREPFYQMSYFTHGGRQCLGKVCVVDDIAPDALAGAIIPYGYDVMSVAINNERRPTESVQRRLREEIFNYGPQVVVIDKGLGHWNSFDLIQYLRDELGAYVVMHTGEWQTDVTRRVADAFIEKPADVEVIMRAIRAGLPTR